MKKWVFIALLSLSASTCHGQKLENPVQGPISAASVTCTPGAATCVWMKLAPNQGTVAVTITGTFVETLIVEQSSDNGITFNTVGTISSPVAAQQFSVSGMTDFRVRCSVYGSGTSLVTLQSSAASVGGGGAPTGAAGGDLSGTYPNPTVAQVNGLAVPLSANVLGSNGSGQFVNASANVSATTFTCGIVGATSCVITGAGSTSGTATITWPAVAGTISNALVFSNAITVNSTIQGNGTIQAGAGSAFCLIGRSCARSAADGRLAFNNNANGAAGLTRLAFGTESTSNPAFAFSGVNMDVTRGDGTAGATFSIAGGAQVKGILSATAALDFANQAAAGCNDLTITVTGAALGDSVQIGVPNASVPNGTAIFSGYVSSSNTVTVRYCNLVSGDPASGTFRATVTQF